MRILKAVLLVVAMVVIWGALVLFGLMIWSDVRTALWYGHAIETDAACLEQRLCRVNSEKERVALCEGYERRIDNALVYCFAVDTEELRKEGVTVRKGDIGLRVVVDYNRFENFDEDNRPVICKN